MLPGTCCPGLGTQPVSGNLVLARSPLAPLRPGRGWHCPESERWVLRPCSEQHREGCIKPRLPLGCRPPAYLGGRLVAGRGVECPLSAPGLGNAAAPSHFPLGPLLAFQAAAFSIVNLETENKPVGRGGSGEVTGAAARRELAAAKSRPASPAPKRPRPFHCVRPRPRSGVPWLLP